jgi:hypothetical protein
MDKKDGIVVKRRMGHGGFFCSFPSERQHYQLQSGESVALPGVP